MLYAKPSIFSANDLCRARRGSRSVRPHGSWHSVDGEACDFEWRLHGIEKQCPVSENAPKPRMNGTYWLPVWCVRVMWYRPLRAPARTDHLWTVWWDRRLRISPGRNLSRWPASTAAAAQICRFRIIYLAFCRTSSLSPTSRFVSNFARWLNRDITTSCRVYLAQAFHHGFHIFSWTFQESSVAFGQFELIAWCFPLAGGCTAH